MAILNALEKEGSIAFQIIGIIVHEMAEIEIMQYHNTRVLEQDIIYVKMVPGISEMI
jgi:hypothetical protein